MKKQIVIVGGGISGLALLHYLNLKYDGRDDVELKLLEKSNSPGGTIHSIVKSGCIFETGPNGFLNSKSQTLKLVNELGLHESLLPASKEAKVRYIQFNGKLFALPANLKSFLTFPLFNIVQKLRVLFEIIIPRGKGQGESVYAFGERRLGKRFAQIFLDPMVNGIYGGDAKSIDMQAAFPRIHQLEEKYGSLFKAMHILKKKKEVNQNGDMGVPKGTLTSFQNGMTELITKLFERHQGQIVLNQEIETIAHHQKQYTVCSQDTKYTADELYLCAPSYKVAQMIHGLSAVFSEDLGKINYAPMVIVGLVYAKKNCRKVPDGFGYLIPSLEKKKVLGVLFESNIFVNRSSEDQMMFRIMIGGSRHPDILGMKEDALKALAMDELKSQFDITETPQQVFFTAWPNAIPQYDQVYVEAKSRISEHLQQWPNLKIVSNYWNGIALNDCIENAFQAAKNSSF